MVKRIRKVAEERLLVNQEAKDLKLKNLSGEIHICKIKLMIKGNVIKQGSHVKMLKIKKSM